MSGYFQRRWDARQVRDVQAVASARAQVLTPEQQQRKDFWLGVRVMAGIIIGVKAAQMINSAPDWKVAEAMNNLGITSPW